MVSKIFDLFSDIHIRAEDRKLTGILKMLELKLRGSSSSTTAPFPPSHVLLEIITKCNLRCQWCLLSEKSYRETYGTEMALSSVLHLLPQFSGVNVLMLYGLGEPLMFPHLETVVREAKKYVPCVCFTTNGTLLTEQRSKSLAEAGLSRIHVSLDSLDHDFIKRVTGGADMGKILENMEAFSHLTGLPVRIWTVVCGENIDRLHELVSLKRRIPTFEFLHFQIANGSELLEKHHYSSSIPPEKMKAFKSRILKLCKEYGIKTDVRLLPDRPAPFPRTGICPAPWTGTVMINVKGYLVPCCILRTKNMANVHEIGFKNAWNYVSIRRFRKNILKGKYIPDCYNWCGYKSIFELSSQDQGRWI